MRWLPFALIAVPSVGAAPLPSADDLKLMQGTWIVVSFHRGGSKLPDEKTTKMSLDIKDDTFTFKGDGPEDDPPGKVKIDSTTKPKTLDLTIKAERIETIPFIFELDGDNLKLCWNEPANKGRPTAFDATKATGLLVLKRKK
jgi:uncharacterized protein (TIGR03067 family)